MSYGTDLNLDFNKQKLGFGVACPRVILDFLIFTFHQFPSMINYTARHDFFFFFFYHCIGMFKIMFINAPFFFLFFFLADENIFSKRIIIFYFPLSGLIALVTALFSLCVGCGIGVYL